MADQYDSSVFTHDSLAQRLSLDDSNLSPRTFNDCDNQYQPVNVRNLVHNLHKTMNPPVPPPRRTRPLSAGPYRSPTHGQMNGTLDSDLVVSGMSSPTRERPSTATGGRILPSRPDDKMAGSTPPRLGGRQQNLWQSFGAI